MIEQQAVSTPVESLPRRGLLGVAIGQSASAFGSTLTAFALAVWVYAQTGSLLQYGAVLLVHALFAAVAAPALGALCDRLPRAKLMIAADCGAAIVIGTLLLAAQFGKLEVWIVALAVGGLSLCAALHQIASRALLPEWIPASRLSNVNGILDTGLALGAVIAPLCATLVLDRIGLPGVLLLDLLSFGVAIVGLLVARLPMRAPIVVNGSHQSGVAAGWRTLRADAQLSGLLIVALMVGLALSTLQALFVPLVLARYSNITLGAISSAAALGAVAGGLWRVLSHKSPGARSVLAAQGLLGLGLCAVALSPTPLSFGLAMFASYAVSQSGAIALRTIWQRRLAPSVRGRALACLTACSAASMPLAYLGAPLLAERVFQPLLATCALQFALPSALSHPQVGGAALLLTLIGLALALSSVALHRAPRWRISEPASSLQPSVKAFSQGGTEKQVRASLATQMPRCQADFSRLFSLHHPALKRHPLRND
jgi:MFS transporter, DHA3 family, macrolide efflux protein